MKFKTRIAKSIRARLVFFLTFCVVMPAFTILFVVIRQSYEANLHQIETGINNELRNSSASIFSVMENMKSVSQLMSEEGNLGKQLHLYFREFSYAKYELYTTLRESIASYESANPNVANITYFTLIGNEKIHKINSSSLARERLPNESQRLIKGKQFDYYGPHITASVVSNYPVISLMREVKLNNVSEPIYCYIESGFRTLERFMPDKIQGMECVFAIISADGTVNYSNDEQVLPVGEKTDFSNIVQTDSGKYLAYQTPLGDSAEIRVMIKSSLYHKQLYTMALSIVLISCLVVLLLLFMSLWLWRSVYRPFKEFDHTLKRISEGGDVELQIERLDVKEFDESFAYFSKMQKRILKLLAKVQAEEKEKAELELKSLIGKMNPHFISNTLDTLKWHSDMKGYTDIVGFITALNKLLMYNMEKTGRATLKSELDAIADYIEIQEFKYELNFTMDTLLPVQMLRADVPRFILQPIVENAILHSEKSPYTINVTTALADDGRISIKISNDGCPIDEKLIERILKEQRDVSSNGIGLQYVTRILKARFGDEFVMKIDRIDDKNVFELIFPFEVRSS